MAFRVFGGASQQSCLAGQQTMSLILTLPSQHDTC